MPQEEELTGQQEQNAVDDTKLTTAITNKIKAEKKQTKIDDTTKSNKRTAPNDAGQGDAKRKATHGSKKPDVTLKGTDPNSLAANAVALLSSVTPSVTQVKVDTTHQATPKQLTTEIMTTTSLADSLNSKVAVAPSTSSEHSTASEMSPPGHNLDEFLKDAALAQSQQLQGQSQEMNSSGKRSSTSRNLSNDERRQRRLLRNRVAAKECRRKKKAYVADLEEKATRLEEENIRLHKEVEELKNKLALSAIRIEEGTRLQKELEELNAKVALRTGQGESKLS